MTRSATALLTLLALLAALLSIMTWAARRTHNAADFAIANRRLGPWLVTLSYAATGVNAWMLMTVAAAAFLIIVCAVSAVCVIAVKGKGSIDIPSVGLHFHVRLRAGIR